MSWFPKSWRECEARQQPVYPDAEALAAAERELGAYAPLVPIAEVDALSAALAEAQAGRAFLLQGGDCAESFAEFSPANIEGQCRLARGDGGADRQCLGPRRDPGRADGGAVRQAALDGAGDARRSPPAYRGDIVNGIAFDSGRAPARSGADVPGLCATGATLVHLRAAVASSPATKRCFFPTRSRSSASIRPPAAYASSAHFLWVGDRTRFPGSAHVEFLRGLSNPLGIKCGPSLEPDVLLAPARPLNPNRVPGRITLIAGWARTGWRPPCPPWSAPPPRRTIRCSGPAIRCTATRSAPPTVTRPGRWPGSSASLGLFRRHRGGGSAGRRDPYRDDRAERHRMYRRRRPAPSRISRALSHPLRPAPQPRAGDGACRFGRGRARRRRRSS